MKISVLLVAALSVMAMSCTSKKAVGMVGADKDAHGCKGSAGYQWSEVKNDCIRIFEEGTALTSTTDKTSGLAAFIVFAADSSKVEVFIPGVEKNPILKIQGKAGYWSENPKFMGAYNLTHKNGVWELLQGNDPIYSTKK